MRYRTIDDIFFDWLDLIKAGKIKKTAFSDYYDFLRSEGIIIL
jgi:hypothetical protein